jgi:putative spermidine/putrescine transport system permease protein
MREEKHDEHPTSHPADWFDEIIVTTFTAGSGVQTLPIFILENMFRPNQAPIVAVVAVVMILIAIVPIYIAQRLTSSDNR